MDSEKISIDMINVGVIHIQLLIHPDDAGQAVQRQYLNMTCLAFHNCFVLIH